mmetsp:Transcript_25206/g.37231  ORF Transcript_25206/g.37231 Transcript_25206/m.37231 type:complete len:540 (-) Transcript_25206:212-1831(-)|eukprot:CAMPEP_0194205808 /NCGR_PEP_ID=MMETSP0156-20130528/5014_1 /TAXON_ID=33649 /ORGANISM="Thalassionema nitzschioides, Strain L26-B" /LENGTH=539 /DNA_ID=CAMNT_0038932189 /DNA_START=58 /DNA_END=1677 /DNA_ORIENTATION=+
MKAETPQILWHNGKDNDENKNAPLFSISVLESGMEYNASPSSCDKFGLVLATAGNHEVNLWKLRLQPSSSTTMFSKLDRSNPNQLVNVEFLLALTRHDTTVNAVKFSPNGLHLASASDSGTILIYSVPPAMRGGGNGQHYWSTLESENQLSIKVLSGFDGIYDLDWSCDSKRLCVGSLDHTVAIYEDEHYNTNVASNSKEKDSQWKCVYRNSRDHSHYIQGVAMDPLQNYVCTMSCDRTVRVYPRKVKKKHRSQDAMTEQRLELGKGKLIKYRPTTNKDSLSSEKAPKRLPLFAEEASSESFFRRLAWTTDGAYLITPAAVWGNDSATCLFRRHSYDLPCKVLLGHDKPSRVVAPNPVLFTLPEGKATHEGLPYKTVFAVLTEKTVLIYDTCHSKPLAMARGLHFSGLTDAVWTPNGHTLIVSSCDGYLSFLMFHEGELGYVYHKNEPAPTRTELEHPAGKKARIVSPATKITKNMDVNVLQPRKKESVETSVSPDEKCKNFKFSSPSPEDKRVEPNILQPKKKKKRVALTLVSTTSSM